MHPLERRFYRRTGMSFADQAPGQIALGIGTNFQSAKRCAVRCFDVGGGTQTVFQPRVDLPAHCQVLLSNQLARNRAESNTVDLQPHRLGAAGIEFQGGDPRNALHLYSSPSSPEAAPAPTVVRMPSNSLTFPSTSVWSAGLSRRKSLAFSRPWPIRWSP